MRRLVVAVDCDDVIVQTTPFFVAMYNRLYQTTITLDKAHLEDKILWRADRTTLEARFADLMKTPEYKKLRPSNEEVVVLTELSQRHELHIITARREHERELTQYMIDTYLPGVFTSLDLVGYTGSKGEVCKRIKADVLIDDNVRHLSDAIKHGLPSDGAILYGDYPWNKDVTLQGAARRCANWKTVEEVIDELAR